MRVILAQRVTQIFSAKKKQQRATGENRHSCEGSPILCSRLFCEIRTFGRAVEGSSVSPPTNAMGGLSGGRRGCDTSGAITVPSFVGTSRRKRSAVRWLTASSLRARRSASPASVPAASMLLSRERSSRGRAVLPDPLLQQQLCLQCWLEWECYRIEAEHDARPPFLALALPARLRPAVPHVRRQLHWRALHHIALPVTVSFHRRHVLWRQPLRCVKLRRNATHTCTNGGPSCS